MTIANGEIEHFAYVLHEAGREAVEKGAVVNKIQGQPFLVWNQITEEAREGRRIQARYILDHYDLTPRPSAIAEGFCPKRKDLTHCQCWWDDSGPCCACGDDTGAGESDSCPGRIPGSNYDANDGTEGSR